MSGAVQSRVFLVVDDDQDCADTIAMLLTRLGATVHVAYSGAAAIEMVPVVSPDIVLLDIGMPGMDGCETARRIADLDPMRRPRLVALTGWGRPEDRQRTSDAGFDRHLVKPPSIDDLSALLSG